MFEVGNRSRFFAREFASINFRLPLPCNYFSFTVARTMKFSGVIILLV